MTANFSNCSERFLRTTCMIRLARLAGIVTLGLALAATASAQYAIVPLYGDQTAPEGPSIAQLKTGWVVTAGCTPAGTLILTVWEDTGSALVQKGSNSEMQNCNSAAAITSFSPDMVVTVYGNSLTGTDQVIAWHVSSAGLIKPLGTASVPLYDNEAAIAQLDATQVVTGLDTSAGVFTVTAWQVSSTGVVTQEGSASAAGLIPTISGLNSSQVVTATSTVSGDLTVTAWGVDSSGNVTEQGDATGGKISWWGSNTWTSDTVLTAVSNPSGELVLSSWTVSGAGVVKRQSTGETGKTNANNSVVCIIPTDNLPFVALSSGPLFLNAEVWDRTAASVLSEIAGDESAWIYTPTAVAGISPHRVVTASLNNTAPNDMELEVWELEE